MKAPRDNLIRMVTFDLSELRTEGDGRTMVGYPIVFDQWTRIRSWEGDFMERIAPGATKKTIRENTPKVLFNHGYDPQIGDKPLGVPQMLREDNKGLRAEVPLSDTSYNQDLAVLINDGAIDGMSFRFSVVKEAWNATPGRSKNNPDGLPERTVQELKMPEFGPVTFPAYQATEVGMRSRNEFQMWQQLPEETRQQLRSVLDGRSTSSAEAGQTTSDDGAAATNADEPVVSTTRAMTRSQRQAALIAHGVTRHESSQAA